MADTVFTTAENNTWAHTLPGKMTSACVALVAPGNHVLMVKASYKNEWTFPSGIVDMGESPAQAAQRELAEETGLALELSPQDIVLLFILVAMVPVGTALILPFARSCRRSYRLPR